MEVPLGSSVPRGVGWGGVLSFAKHLPFPCKRLLSLVIVARKQCGCVAFSTRALGTMIWNVRKVQYCNRCMKEKVLKGDRWNKRFRLAEIILCLKLFEHRHRPLMCVYVCVKAETAYMAFLAKTVMQTDRKVTRQNLY